MIIRFSIFILILEILFSNQQSTANDAIKLTDTNKKAMKNLEYKKKLMDYENKMQNGDIIVKNKDPDFIKYKSQMIKEIINRSSLMYEHNLGNDNHNSTSLLEIARNIPDIDNPSRFFNSTYEKNINNLPQKGRVKIKPWSGSYWPMKNGITSVRYAKNDKSSIGVYDPRERSINYEYKFLESVNKYKQPSDYLQQITYGASSFEKFVLDNYSPSEKYDLLVGDNSYTLTNWNKNEGLKYIKEFGGDLPSWFGICHGWAIASYYHPKPTKSVNMVAADGRTKITFYPDDIKALASLHLANLNYRTNFVGAICKVYPPKKPIADIATGLWMENMCHALNPGSLVTILANHVGMKRQNLVLDPLSDNEVWNQPILSYKFRYYNLITQEFSSTPKRAKVPIGFIKGSSDKFLNFLSLQSDWKTSSVVGVYMNITYMYETSPVHSARAMDDYEKNDQFIGAVQLDREDNIIGGEWKYNAHPNFIWHYDTRFPMESCCDNMVKNYEGKANPNLTRWAKETSKNGQILKSVIDYLVSQAKGEDKIEEDSNDLDGKSATNSEGRRDRPFTLINDPTAANTNSDDNISNLRIADDLVSVLSGL